ncbi:hypothetical protein L7F22_067425 [Adiantum nelumboides]|nr:hypothetical protein [Adiantum nelumboides]
MDDLEGALLVGFECAASSTSDTLVRIWSALIHTLRSQWDSSAGSSRVAEERRRSFLRRYTDTGFNINNVLHEGSLMCHGNLILTWTPKTFKEITPESLSIFELLRPAPDLLLIGCGRSVQFVDKELKDFLKSNGIKVEAIDSRNAASTFNFLNDEGRLVAAAILPCCSEA